MQHDNKAVLHSKQFNQFVICDIDNDTKKFFEKLIEFNTDIMIQKGINNKYFIKYRRKNNYAIQRYKIIDIIKIFKTIKQENKNI